MSQTSEPEILRCSLTSSILQLKCIGQNMEELDLMDKPELDSSKSRLSLVVKTSISSLTYQSTPRLKPSGSSVQSTKTKS